MSDDPSAADAVAAPSAPAAECAVCWQEFDDASAFARLPCCTAPEGSTMRYCVRCVEIICEGGPGGVGRCPTCRAFIKRREDGDGFAVADRVEQCVLCRQPRVIVAEIRGMPACDACFQGAQNPLRYECQRCGRFQRIPHPMYRYQVDGPTAFGNNTWACHVGCGDQTHWRVAAADAHLVPPDDAPEAWGLRDEWLQRVREQRRQEAAGLIARRPGVAPAARPGAGGGGPIERFLNSYYVFVALAIILFWLRGG